MDGENNGKPYEQMDDFPLFLETPICALCAGLVIFFIFCEVWAFDRFIFKLENSENNPSIMR